MIEVASGRFRIRHEHSAGGAVLWLRQAQLVVAMIATRSSTRWGLPKGALGRHETSQQAALREVLEETGIRATIVSELDQIDYSFRAGDTLIQKRVDFFLMRRESGRLRPQLTEVDAVEWVELEEAIQRASYHSERRLLEKSRTIWSELPEEVKGTFSTLDL